MNLEKIKEINRHISDALEMWSNVMLEAEDKQWAYYLNYGNIDLFNVLYIFEHVMSNKAIKRGILNEKNVKEKSNQFVKAIRKIYDIDTREVTILALEEIKKRKENGTETEKNSPS